VLQGYLKAMKTEGVSPNRDTFHSVLKSIGITQRKDKPKFAPHVPAVLAEMMALGFSEYIFQIVAKVKL